MSDYTPTTEEMLDGYVTMRRREIPGDRVLASIQALSEADRWLAAHDAEKDLEIARQADIIALLREDEAELHRLRAAGVVAEEPEWQYGIQLDAHPDADVVPVASKQRATAHAAVDGVTAMMRTTIAGEWVPVNQEGAET